MNNTMHSRKSAARTERLQKRLDAGFITTHFPDVASIVISMMYRQKGLTKSLPRIVNFFPGSCALFRIDCLSKECVDGAFDLPQVITKMIENRRESSKGEVGCEGASPSADHSELSMKLPSSIHK